VNKDIAYNHTSHGSQIITGMDALENYPGFDTKGHLMLLLSD
jgi:hypothetical protein